MEEVVVGGAAQREPAVAGREAHGERGPQRPQVPVGLAVEDEAGAGPLDHERAIGDVRGGVRGRASRGHGWGYGPAASPQTERKAYPTGAAKISPSTMSRKPPYSGRNAPESFTPARRLRRDSTRSPS